MGRNAVNGHRQPSLAEENYYGGYSISCTKIRSDKTHYEHTNHILSLGFIFIFFSFPYSFITFTHENALAGKSPLTLSASRLLQVI